MAMKKLLAMMIVALGMAQAAMPAFAQGPLQITITDGVIEPLPVAVPTFQAETAGAEQLAQQISRVVVEDLVGRACSARCRPRPSSLRSRHSPSPSPMPIGGRSTCRVW